MRLNGRRMTSCSIIGLFTAKWVTVVGNAERRDAKNLFLSTTPSSKTSTHGSLSKVPLPKRIIGWYTDHLRGTLSTRRSIWAAESRDASKNVRVSPLIDLSIVWGRKLSIWTWDAKSCNIFWIFAGGAVANTRTTPDSFMILFLRSRTPSSSSLFLIFLINWVSSTTIQDIVQSMG